MKRVSVFLLLVSSLWADANSDLIKAASRGRTRAIKKAIAAGADINFKNEEGLTAVLAASKRPQKKALLYLLEQNPDLTITDNEQNTILHYLAAGRDAKLIPTTITKGANANLINAAGDSPLHVAAKGRRKLKHMQALVAAGANINAADANGMTILLLAAKKGDRKALAWLKGAQLDASKSDKEGNNVLHYIVVTRYHKLIPDFVSRGAALEHVNNEQLSPLHLAITKNKTRGLRTLLTAGANPNHNIETLHPLWYAFNKKRWAIWTALLQGGANSGVQNEKGKTLLIRGIEMNSSWIVGKLIAAKADLNQKDSSGWTPLTLAAQKNRTKITSMLLNAQADYNLININNNKPAEVMVARANYNLLKYYVKAGINLEEKHSQGRTLLRIAHDRFMKRFNKTRSRMFVNLVRAGADINIANKDGEPIFFDYLHKKVPYYVELLLKKGVKTDQPDRSGNYPLHVAVDGGRYKLVKALVDAKAKIDSRDKDNHTPLMLAVKNQNPILTKLLLAREADVNARNNKQETSLHIAIGKQNPKLVKMLLDHGAETSATNKFGNTILIELAKADPYSKNKKTLEILKVLAGAGVDLNKKNKYGNTALMYAVNRKNSATIGAFLAAGARSDVTDQRGNSAAHKLVLAALYQKLKNQNLFNAVYTFRKHNAALTNRNEAGKSPLILAAEAGEYKDIGAAAQIIQAYLDLGIDVSTRDFQGSTASEYAARNQDYTIRNLFSLNSATLPRNPGFRPLHIGNTGDDVIADQKTLSDGSILVTLGSSDGTNRMVMSLNAQGGQNWSIEVPGAHAATIDPEGNLYVQGVRLGSFHKKGKIDRRCKEGENKVIFLTKYDSSRNEVYTKTYGRSRACNDTAAFGIASDSQGAIYMGIAYGKRKKYVFRYTPEGKQKWKTRWNDDWTYLSIDADDRILLHGSILHELERKKGWRKSYVKGKQGTIIARHDKQYAYAKNISYGIELRWLGKRKKVRWRRQFASDGTDTVRAVAVDMEGNIYVAGRTSGNLHGFTNKGGTDCFLIKVDSNGKRLWTRQFGSAGNDNVFRLAAAPGGGVILAGQAGGEMIGLQNAGATDAFLLKIDAAGNVLN